jgi:inosose dehydratase
VSRIAGAPISWGVCEVPGWGHQLAPARVLREMGAIGLAATELGPEGYLPEEPDVLRDLLDVNGLRLVGGFLPATLHRADRQAEELAHAARFADLLAAGGAEVVALAAADDTGYESSTDLDRDQWDTFLRGIDRVMELGAERELVVALHPHYGTLIESQRDVERVLESSPVSLCIDTGHLTVCGADPVEVTRAAAERVVHVHLKDVDQPHAERMRAGGTGYQESVADGMFRPLGRGDVDIEEVVRTLERFGYQGWYVLEQDTVLTGEPAENAGPIQDTPESLAFLKSVMNGIQTDVSA